MTKTKFQKQLAGTLRPDRDRTPLTCEPLNEVPQPFAPLSDTGKRYFQAVCEVLLSNGTLTAADLPAITRAAEIYEFYVDAKKAVRELGAWTTTQSGYTSKSAPWQVMTDAEKALASFERSFGLTLAARAKLPPAPVKEGPNPFDQF